jgi:N-acetylglucosamine kinase-like BadF-type ATPase
VLAEGTPEGWGVALICGTGSIGYARAPDGRSARAGGWGFLLGDEGSGYDVARRAMRLATQTADGRAGAPAILQAVLDHWGLSDPPQLVQQIYRTGMTPAEVATLAQRVAALAEAGDPHAAAIVDEAAHELARLGMAAARQLDLRQPPIALAGGLFGASPRLRAGIAERAGAALGSPTYVAEPARGALEIARRMLV